MVLTVPKGIKRCDICSKEAPEGSLYVFQSLSRKPSACVKCIAKVLGIEDDWSDEEKATLKAASN